MTDEMTKKHLLEICLDYAKNLESYITFSRDDMIRGLNIGMDAVKEAESRNVADKELCAFCSAPFTPSPNFCFNCGRRISDRDK